MQYADRQKVAAEYRAKLAADAERRAASSLADPAPSLLVPSEPVGDDDQQGVERGEAGSRTDGRQDSLVGASSASTSQPVIIECCCGERSTLGQIQNKCKVIRITKQSADQSTCTGRQKAMQITTDSPGALLWPSFPCTVGCPWWSINESRPRGKAKRKAHLDTFLTILSAWVPLAREVVLRGGCLAWAWAGDTKAFPSKNIGDYERLRVSGAGVRGQGLPRTAQAHGACTCAAN